MESPKFIDKICMKSQEMRASSLNRSEIPDTGRTTSGTTCFQVVE